MNWQDLLANWGPLLLLIAVWVFFMLLLMRKGGPQSRALTEQKRHNDALEKILASHEARLQKLEDEKRAQKSN